MFSPNIVGSVKLIVFFIICFAHLNVAEEIEEYADEIESSADDTELSAEELYLRGIDDHNDNNWSGCINNFEKAISKHKRILTAIADCRIRCSNREYEYLNPQNIEDLYFYEKMVRRTLCFMKCKRLNYPDIKFNNAPDENVVKELANLDAYLYLQGCYLKENQNTKAASAAFTYVVRHPDNFLSKNNLKYFLELSVVDIKEITNYEAEEYYSLYLNAVNSYNQKDWEQTIAYMEEAVHAYFAADERCRVLCEGSFDQGWLPDFTASVSNHFTYCLQCKQGCADKLKTLDGVKGEELLADFYNYLQFAYFKMKNYNEAVRCVASFLLMYPADEEMQRNKNLYMDRVDLIFFEPRPELVYYLGRNKYERKLLKFIEDEFTTEIKKQNGTISSDEQELSDTITKSFNSISMPLDKTKEKSKVAKSEKSSKIVENKNPFQKYRKF